MARKKGSSDFEEPQDEANIDAQLEELQREADEGQPVTVEPMLSADNPRVNLKEQAPSAEPELSASTKAELEAGKQAVEEKAKLRAENQSKE